MFQGSVREEARKWVEEMKRAVAPQDLLRAASQLRGMAVRTRGAVSPRGSLSESGEALVSKKDLEDVLQELRKQPVEVRREVALALGEAGGEDIVQALAELAKDPDPAVRLLSADALGKIGGPQAVKELVFIAQNDPDEDVRALAVEALGILALHEHKNAVRSRGAVCGRGSTVHEEKSRGLNVETVRETLEKICYQDRSPYVRDAAFDVLSRLGSR